MYIYNILKICLKISHNIFIIYMSIKNVPLVTKGCCICMDILALIIFYVKPTEDDKLPEYKNLSYFQEYIKLNLAIFSR